MDISGNDLITEYRRAVHQWPFLISMERAYNLPPFLLFAVGSRETNLRNVVGDYGHGHGVFQLDNRSHTIPDKFDSDVKMQGQKASQMLAQLIHYWGNDIKAAISSYNAGTGNARQGITDIGDSDAYTANHNYARDVLDRQKYLLQTFGRHLPNPVPPAVHHTHHVYTVQNNDTLSSIAHRFKISWQRLYKDNRGTIGNDPNLIFVGEHLVVPGR